MQYLGYLLVAVHVILLLWSGGGFLEMILPRVPWPRFTNSDFPYWWLPIHWGSVLVASTGFLYGYFTAWNKTPHFMMGAYGLLALVCVFETLGYMTSHAKYMAMAAEYLAYAIILILLFRSEYFINYFKQI